MSSEDPTSSACRQAAFEWLRGQVDIGGDVLSRQALSRGFAFHGERVRLVGPQGIFKPAQIRYYPLSITTTSRGPYDDSFAPDGKLLLYRYRGTDPDFHENRRLRDAMQHQVPLIYFHSTFPGDYLAMWPVFIVGDQPKALTFTVAVDDMAQLQHEHDDADDEIRRGYITRVARQRIHQRTFRDRVLAAYREQCTVCHLRHANLLDAAHIIPDTDPEGAPVVSNGLSLCKLHHAAFDRSFFGIRPDYRIEVRGDILEEQDGPILLHGLQEIHHKTIRVPRRQRDRPDPGRLEQRYESFRSLAAP
jgi:putative restriction endonuclease